MPLQVDLFRMIGHLKTSYAQAELNVTHPSGKNFR